MKKLFLFLILFVLAHQAKAQLAHPNVGIIELANSDLVGPAGNGVTYISSFDGWSNPHMRGVLLRSIWQVTEPNDGSFYDSFIVAGQTAAAASGKVYGLLVDAGESTPDFVYGTAGVTKWMFQNGVDQNTGQATYLYQPLPWESAYQAKWFAHIDHLASLAANDPNCAWVLLEGSNRQAESFFVAYADGGANGGTTGLGDVIDADARASAAGFSGTATVYGGHPALEGWETAEKTILARYIADFPNKFIVLISGNPFPTSIPAGQNTLADFINWANTTYPGHFGYESDGLTANLQTTQFGYTNIVALSPTTRTGWQFNKAITTGLPDMTNALNIGITSGANYIEVFGGNATDPTLAVAYDLANLEMGVGGTPGRTQQLVRRILLLRLD